MLLYIVINFVAINTCNKSTFSVENPMMYTVEPVNQDTRK